MIDLSELSTATVIRRLNGRINWDRVPLGQATDLEIARLLRVSDRVVRYQRTKRRIPAFAPQPTAWSCDLVLTEIRRLAEAGRALGYKETRRSNRSLLEAAKRYIGGWREAIIEASSRWPDCVPLARGVLEYRVVRQEPESLPGQLLRAARQRAGMSQREAAESLGISPCTWSNYEHGHLGVAIPEAAWELLRQATAGS